jgi:hypothetical protein
VIPGGKHGQNLINQLFFIKKHLPFGDAFFYFVFIMRVSIFSAAIILFLYSCTQPQKYTAPAAKLTVDKHWLDSIIKTCDSNSVKPYKRIDFVTAASYFNKKDSIVCQVMKDSVDTIRQVIVAKKEVRIFFAQYFANGQLQASLPLDTFGQYHGKAIYYYEDGSIESSGNYVHGLKQGQWQHFDSRGNLTSTDEYNSNGQVVASTRP